MLFTKPHNLPSPWRVLGPALVLCTTFALAADYPVKPVPFTSVRITGGFWQPRQEVNRKVTLPFAFEQCEATGRIKNFDQAAEVLRRRAAGEKDFQMQPLTEYTFDDSDAYKSIEGAAYALSLQRDPALEALCDGIITRIAAAQEPDGYLYTWRTMHPDSPAHPWIHEKRWLNDPDLSHELYNLGHLYEAGTAYYQATGKRALLDVCLKSAELLWKNFGKGDLKIAPGHQVVEMGLAKLYRITGDERWIKLAKFFLDVRGPGGDTYAQMHKRVVDQDEAVGHAVRAGYMYSGMADVAALTGDPSYMKAITRIWDNVVGRKLYITGGIGARGSGEAFGDDYELPQRAYNETCAAIANLMWNHRMFLMTGESKFMDVFERTLYNGFLSGVSLSGDRFFYPNPLVYDGKSRNNHGHAGRAPWFGCACCPPNVLRTLAALSGYMYAVKDDRLFVNLYAQSQATTEVAGTSVTLSQTTDYPWSGRIRMGVDPAKPGAFSLCIRIPGWTQGQPLPSDLYAYRDAKTGLGPWTVSVNGKAVPAELRDGYAILTRTWRQGDRVDVDLPMPVRTVVGNAHVAATRGRVALERGPMVYCLEGSDNGGDIFDVAVPALQNVKPVSRPGFLGGVTVLDIQGAHRVSRLKEGGTTSTRATVTAIPYFAWANRGPSPMQVWLPTEEKDVPLPPKPTLASESKVSVSFMRQGMGTEALSDQLIPQNATDGFAPHFDFWPHNGGVEWVDYQFKAPATVSQVSVCWFDDQPSGGGCAVPESWRLLYRTKEGAWQPVTGASYPTTRGALLNTTFTPVTTTGLRLEVHLQPGLSAGLYEWAVQ
ncbi:glycoside hydrolase family 127 protein [Geothrix sp. PMB-07]|uniref:glycoside hydrolase family 127 protein n=1 Tax=Geothrix sp. PMB-07 TaxID=3068640 RepID=UPI002740C74A|nr:glycoside hydrolase family 127 protein [Geothrix sp. PMB-07]WLT30955.1 glycoside hydrolase family 127 protein [Geothrix sp. PMB-07]